MRCRVPIVYLFDSAGVNLPFRAAFFPVIRRGADFLLQLDHAPLPESSADFSRDGNVRRGRRVSARAFGCDFDG